MNRKIKRIRTKSCNSPSTYLRDKLFEPVIHNSKKKPKITDDDFEIPKFDEYEKLLKFNYRVPQLKDICKHYGQKKTGNKNELISRIFNYMKFSFHALQIQRIGRGYLQRKCNFYHGPAFIKRDLCVNETDFFTLDKLKDIPYNQFFSFKDSDGFIYGYDILSLYNLIDKNRKARNPYNRQELPIKMKRHMRSLRRISRVLNIPINIDIKEEEDVIPPAKRLEMRIISSFQVIDSLGNYSDASWFNDMSRHDHIKFLRELVDIWEYRAQLSHHAKREICPPAGNPFTILNFNNLPLLTIDGLKKTSISIVEILVKNGINRDSQALGAYYVLAALTLVSDSARNSLPWLYQSVAHN